MSCCIEELSRKWEDRRFIGALVGEEEAGDVRWPVDLEISNHNHTSLAISPTAISEGSA